MEVVIKQVDSVREVPLDLLLLADPLKDKVECYMDEGVCLIALVDSEIVGEVVIVSKEVDIMEIINVAVKEDFQGRGIGKKLIIRAIELAKTRKANRIEIGTGNSSLKQLGLYQLCGFSIFEIWENHFIKNYTEEIFEDGIQCKDMVRLKIDL